MENNIPDFSKFNNEELFRCLWNIKANLPKFVWDEYIEIVDKFFEARQMLSSKGIQLEIKIK